MQRPLTTAQAPRRPGLALAVIATAELMVVLDLTIVTVALPHIQAALGFSGSNLEWVINAYAVAFGLNSNPRPPRPQPWSSSARLTSLTRLG
jgi:hypothetical protein